MQKIQLRHGDWKWPGHCVVCLDYPTGSVTLSRTVVTGVFLLASVIPREWRSTKVEYPVCQQHLLPSRVASALGRKSLFKLFILAFAFFGLATVVASAVAYAADGNTNDATRILAYGAIPAAVIALYFWSRRQMPVRIVEFGEHSTVLAFSNRTYLDFFEQANRELVLRRDPRIDVRLL